LGIFILKTAGKIRGIKLEGNRFNRSQTDSFWNLWNDWSQKYSDKIALKDDYNNIKYTYSSLFEHIKMFAAGLNHLGVKKGDHVALFSENCAKWMVVDQALFLNGAVDVVRGSLAPVDELVYIYKHSDSTVLIAETSNIIQNVSKNLEGTDIKFAVYLFDDTLQSHLFDFPVYSFEEVLEIGSKRKFKNIEIDNDSPATIIYSSGTTGEPKGIVLSYENLLSQIRNFHPVIGLKTGKRALSILPIWHAYERTCEYYLLSCGTKIVYTNVRNFKKDIKKYQPHYIVSVPRLWEALYDGIMSEVNKQPYYKKKMFEFFLDISKRYKKSLRVLNRTCINRQNPSYPELLIEMVNVILLSSVHNFADKLLYRKLRRAISKSFIKGISGGGALARHLDDFFEAIGLDIVVGYGLTETSPVLTCRTDNNNKMYSAGQPIPGTEIKIVDPETKKRLGKNQKGLVLVRGPQVMLEYYKDEEATNAAIDRQGWFNTGDLGWLSNDNTLVLTGRYKDTIVLSNGENIEPAGIEEACLLSPYVRQIVLVGQDKAALGALITPNVEAIKEWARNKNQENISPQKVISDKDFQRFLHKDLQNRVLSRPNFRPFEQIARIKILNEEFSVENGLMTPTAKIRKNKVLEKYSDVIEEMFSA